MAVSAEMCHAVCLNVRVYNYNVKFRGRSKEKEVWRGRAARSQQMTFKILFRAISSSCERRHETFHVTDFMTAAKLRNSWQTNRECVFEQGCKRNPLERLENKCAIGRAVQRFQGKLINYIKWRVGGSFEPLAQEKK